MATMAGGEYTSVKDFYRGRSIFITGGTGFMGKVLVEKLLRSCPGIKNIYLLMRSKKGQNVQQRLEELLNAPVRQFIFLNTIQNRHTNFLQNNKQTNVSILLSCDYSAIRATTPWPSSRVEQDRSDCWRCYRTGACNLVDWSGDTHAMRLGCFPFCSNSQIWRGP